jgi:hypothetical protein
MALPTGKRKREREVRERELRNKRENETFLGERRTSKKGNRESGIPSRQDKARSTSKREINSSTKPLTNSHHSAGARRTSKRERASSCCLDPSKRLSTAWEIPPPTTGRRLETLKTLFQYNILPSLHPQWKTADRLKVSFPLSHTFDSGTVWFGKSVMGPFNSSAPTDVSSC